MDSIRWLAELTAADLPLAGGKGANLGELVRAGFVVPDGFVITTAAYTDFVARHGLADSIRAAAAELVNASAAEPSAVRMGELFATGEVPADLAAEIIAAYELLGHDVPVAVRSSATAEDLAEASFAGQQDTYLNIIGTEALLASVRDCWASLWTDRAIRYRAEHGVDPEQVALAVVVQRLVPADAAGVMFTANPANGRTEETVITAAWGLGEAVVSGLVDTDTVVVDTANGRVRSRQVADKAIRVDPVGGGTAERPNPDDVRKAAVLDGADALRLAGIGSAITAHFGAPQDIEWVLAGGEFSIVQSRPITALPPRTGEVPQEWPVPEKGLYFRASITEQLPDPLTPLFAGLMATAVPTGLIRLLSELAPGRDFGDVGFPTINGYAFYRYSYEAMSRMMLLMSPRTLKLLGGQGSFVELRWRARLADYSAEVAAEQALVGAGLPARSLLDAVGRLVDAMAYYYTAVQTIIPVASMAELTWMGVYDRLLKKPGGPSADTFVLGYDSEPIRAERSLYDLSRWVLEHPQAGGGPGRPSCRRLRARRPGRGRRGQLGGVAATVLRTPGQAWAHPVQPGLRQPGAGRRPPAGPAGAAVRPDRRCARPVRAPARCRFGPGERRRPAAVTAGGWRADRSGGSSPGRSTPARYGRTRWLRWAFTRRRPGDCCASSVTGWSPPMPSPSPWTCAG